MRRTIFAQLPPLLCALWIAAPLQATTVDPSDANILYTGRWDASNPSQPWAQSKGSSIIVNFEGTTIEATLTNDSDEYFRIIIDDDAVNSTKTQLSSGVSVPLASGLTDAAHKLELVKETDKGSATLQELELDSGKSLVAPPARPPRRIVFYGDSNLAGHSLESEQDESPTILQGCYYTYAGVTARMFDAEYHNISKSGATITSLNSAYDRIDWDANNTSWNFNNFIAELVVVNIGANDSWRSKNQNKGNYHDLLDDLRADHPSAHIMLFNAYGWDDTEPANYTHEVIAERDDPNMSSAIFPWVFEQFHGCESDHAGMAQYLADHITDVLGWIPAASDVVSGYGVGANVANGSFEERAPFGGWGWRYFDDTGVSRVQDPAGAFAGDYYLRLQDGASNQQTNPSSDGELRSVVAWMRGASNGEEVDIRMEFRDQEAGADPGSATLQSETQTVPLTTSWQPHTMSVTAPNGGGNPVYSVRVTFTAGSGDTVDIDNVAAFVPEPSEVALLASGASLLALLARPARRRKP